jgi:AmmeMemoRadiSam system protein B
MLRYLGDQRSTLPNDGLFAIAAPHVSPEGGWQSYAAAYRMLGPEYRDRIFVVLGTSHYGEPEKFGLTRKDFITPLGRAVSDRAIVDLLEQKGGDAVEMEDFCHSFEHTIEFQVLFLQHAVAPDVRIVPILCGSYARSLQNGGLPDDHDGVKRFLDALGELHDREREKLFWVLGVDMAHMGSRYGDPFQASANQGVMNEVSARDQARIERINAADAAGFWDLVRPNGDDLKWCGSSPFYTFLKAAPKARGSLLHYEHWNIDEQSVVSFAGMAFTQ